MTAKFPKQTQSRKGPPSSGVWGQPLSHEVADDQRPSHTNLLPGGSVTAQHFLLRPGCGVGNSPARASCALRGPTPHGNPEQALSSGPPASSAGPDRPVIRAAMQKTGADGKRPPFGTPPQLTVLTLYRCRLCHLSSSQGDSEGLPTLMS